MDLKNKYMSCICKFSILMLIIVLLTACEKKIENVNNIYIEVLDVNEENIQKIEMNTQDKRLLIEIFERAEPYTDNGFVFAEGRYRFVLETEKEIIHIYSYCGGTSYFKVGEENGKYITLNVEEEKLVKDILKTYVNSSNRFGIWVWN